MAKKQEPDVLSRTRGTNDMRGPQSAPKLRKAEDLTSRKRGRVRPVVEVQRTPMGTEHLNNYLVWPEKTQQAERPRNEDGTFKAKE